MKTRLPFAARDVQSGSQVRCLPPRQRSRYGRDRDDVEPDRDARRSPAALLIRRSAVATVSKHGGAALSEISPPAILAATGSTFHPPTPPHGRPEGTSDGERASNMSNGSCIFRHNHKRTSTPFVPDLHCHLSHLRGSIVHTFPPRVPCVLWSSKTACLPPLGRCLSEKTELFDSPRIRATRH